jgi:hypothetical protein
MSADIKSVAELAYELWVARGRPHGSALQDWAEAERQLEATGAAGQAAAAKIPPQRKIKNESNALQQRRPPGNSAGRPKSPNRPNRKASPGSTAATPGDGSVDDVPGPAPGEG